MSNQIVTSALKVLTETNRIMKEIDEINFLPESEN